MASKTFKIGEYCKGGIIQAISTPETIIVIGKDWDMSAGTKKGSNQSNAKEWTRIEVKPTTLPYQGGSRGKTREFLDELTTSYWTDTIIDWIEEDQKKYGALFV